MRTMKEYASNSRKLAHQMNRRIFLLACKNSGVHPRYLVDGTKRIAMLTQSVDRSNGRRLALVASNVRDRLLTIEIQCCCRTINGLKARSSWLISALSNELDPVLLNDFIVAQRRTFNNIFKKIKHRQVAKLCKLRDSRTDIHCMTNDSWIVNRSSTAVPPDISSFLALGPGFWLPDRLQREEDVYGLLADVEQIVKLAVPEERNILRARATQQITTHINRTRSKTHFLANLEIRTSKFLKENPNLIVTKADKGKVTVLLNKEDYDEKSRTLLEDNRTYKLIPSDPTVTVERKHNQLVTTLQRDGHVTEEMGKRLRVYNSMTPKYYGLPKIHKPDCPLRPIISSLMAPTKPIATLLTGILKDAFSDFLCYRIKDSFAFAEHMADMVVPRDHVLVSFDVISLFTNVPIDLVVRIVEEEWDRIAVVTTMPRALFVRLLSFVFDNTYFSYDGCFYRQIFGTPMGSIISPILAEITMNYLLRKVIPALDFDFGFIWQYVDDIIAALPIEKIEDTLVAFNSFNDNIKFTVERESGGSIPFLDVRVFRDVDGRIFLDWYRKPTSSDRYIHRWSAHPTTYKVNTMLGLKSRVMRLSHPSFHIKNLKLLKEIFTENKYDRRLVNRILFNTPLQNTQPVRLPANVETQEIRPFMTLPMIEDLTPSLRRLFADLPVRIAITSNKRVSSLFTNTKDRTPLINRCNLVYRVPCLGCQSVYIGMTGQRLRARIAQHERDVTNNRESTALAAHVQQSGHAMDYEGVTVLASERTYGKRAFKEMCYIKGNMNTLNYVTDLEGLSTIYSNLIRMAADLRPRRHL